MLLRFTWKKEFWKSIDKFTLYGCLKYWRFGHAWVILLKYLGCQNIYFFEDVRPNNFTNFHTIFLRKVSKERYCICLQCYRELFCILLKNFELHAVLFENFNFFTIFQKIQFWAPRMTLLKPKFKIFSLYSFCPVFYENFKLNCIQNWQFFKKVIKALKYDPFIDIFAVSMATVNQKNFFFRKISYFSMTIPLIHFWLS